MPKPKLEFVTYSDLRHALAVARYFTERGQPGEERDEFARLTMLFREYVECAHLYEQLDERERIRLLTGAGIPKGKA